METSGERAVVREESEGEGSAVLSWLPAPLQALMQKAKHAESVCKLGGDRDTSAG